MTTLAERLAASLDAVDLVMSYLRRNTLIPGVLGFQRVTGKNEILFDTSSGPLLVVVGEVSRFIYLKLPGGERIGFLRESLVELHGQLQ